MLSQVLDYEYFKKGLVRIAIMAQNFLGVRKKTCSQINCQKKLERKRKRREKDREWSKKSRVRSSKRRNWRGRWGCSLSSNRKILWWKVVNHQLKLLIELIMQMKEKTMRMRVTKNIKNKEVVAKRSLPLKLMKSVRLKNKMKMHSLLNGWNRESLKESVSKRESLGGKKMGLRRLLLKRKLRLKAKAKGKKRGEPTVWAPIKQARV
jgi:hypothetical protein